LRQIPLSPDILQIKPLWWYRNYASVYEVKPTLRSWPLSQGRELKRFPLPNL
jgi:hypothetical protein